MNVTTKSAITHLLFSAKYLPWMSLQHQLIVISRSLHLLKQLYRLPCAVYWIRKELYSNLYYSIQSNFSCHDSSFPPLSTFYTVYQKCSNNVTCLYVKTNVTCIFWDVTWKQVIRVDWYSSKTFVTSSKTDAHIKCFTKRDAFCKSHQTQRRGNIPDCTCLTESQLA